MTNKAQKIEIGILLALALYFYFYAVNVNQVLGQIYAGFTIASVAFILFDPKRSLLFKRENDSLPGSLAIGAFAYIGLVIIGTFVIVPGVTKVIELLGATTPALANSVFFNNLSLGVAVPIAETYLFFVVVFDIAASLFNFEIDKGNLTNPKLLLTIGVISAMFMLFHITSKGVSNAPSLALVFFMGVISMLIVTYRKQAQDAVFFHVIANSVPIYLAGGLANLIK